MWNEVRASPHGAPKASLQFDHRLDYARGRIQPTVKICADFAERNAVSDISSRIDEALFHRVQNMLKVCTGRVSATHQCTLAFMKLRMTEIDLAPLKTDHHVAGAVCHVLKSLVDRSLITGCIYDDGRHVSV